jgi:hypothetical protein
MHKSIKNIGFGLFTVLLLVGILMLLSLDSNKDTIKNEKSYYKNRNIAYGLVVIGVIGLVSIYTFKLKVKSRVFDNFDIDNSNSNYDNYDDNLDNYDRYGS